MVLRAFGPGLQSDRIAHRYGFDGYELDGMLSFYSRHRSMGTRSTFAVNTWYPEIAGGYYVNRSLFVLLDEAIRGLGLYPVLFDTFRLEGLVPVEGVGQLCEGEEYLLVDPRQKEIGALKILEYGSSGGSCYKDCVVFDMILPEDLTGRLVEEVEIRSRESHVQFDRVPEVSREPIRRSWWSRLWRLCFFSVLLTGA